MMLNLDFLIHQIVNRLHLNIMELHKVGDTIVVQMIEVIGVNGEVQELILVEILRVEVIIEK